MWSIDLILQLIDVPLIVQAGLDEANVAIHPFQQIRCRLLGCAQRPGHGKAGENVGHDHRDVGIGRRDIATTASQPSRWSKRCLLLVVQQRMSDTSNTGRQKMESEEARKKNDDKSCIHFPSLHLSKCFDDSPTYQRLARRTVPWRSTVDVSAAASSNRAVSPAAGPSVTPTQYHRPILAE